MQIPIPSRAGQRRAAALFILFVFIFNVAASTPSETPPPPDAPTPAQLRAGNWNDKPLDAPSLSAAEKDNEILAIQTPYFCSSGEDLDKLRLATSTLVYSFYSEQTGWDIKTVSLCPLTDVVHLVNSPGVDYDPELSPDASTVAFVSDRTGNDEIFTVDRSGGNLRQLTFDPAVDTMPAYAPNGGAIAFVSDRTGKPEIYSMRPDGSGLARLTNHNAYALYPDFSPDGTKIVYTLSTGRAGLIIVMNSDGTNAHSLTNDFIPYLGRVRWSPKGTRLEFEYDANNDGWFDIGTIQPDGSGMALFLVSQPQYGFYPDLQLGSWTPDERVFIFAKLLYVYSRYYESWFLTGTGIYYITSYDSTVYLMAPESGANMQPHVINPDLTPPRSWIETSNRVQFIKSIDHVAEASYWWNAMDNGPFGLYQSFYKLEKNKDVWVDTKEQTCLPSQIKGQRSIRCRHTISLKYGEGSIIKYRYNTTDLAGNKEAYHDEPDLTFQFYAFESNGFIYDSRNHPLSQVQVKFTPEVMSAPPTDRNGSTLIYYPEAATYQVNYSLPGTAALPTQTMLIESDRDFTATLTSTDEQVTNGHFAAASPLSGWQYDNQVKTSAVDGREGGKSAQVVFDCGTASCLPDSELITRADEGEVAVDSQGTIHVVAVDGAYFTRANDGTWTPGPRLPIARYTSLVITPQDELFIVSRLPQAAIYRKRPAEDWSTLALPAALADPPTLMAGNQDRLHAVFTLTSAEGSRFLYYCYLKPDGAWSTPQLLSPNPIPDLLDVQPAMAEQDGVLYILFRSEKDRLKLTSVQANGNIGPETLLNDPWVQPIDHPQIAVSPDGTLHAIARQITRNDNLGVYQGFNYLYYKRPAGGEWLAPIKLWSSPRKSSNISVYYGWGGIGVDDNNNILVLLLDYKSQTNNLVYLSSHDSGSSWKTVFSTQAGNPTSADFFTTGSQRHVVMGGENGLVYRPVTFITQDQSGGIWQEITLLESMHLPTLSFFYLIDSIEMNGSTSMEALVQEVGQEPVSLLVESGATDDWQHAWADLSPWLGKTVKLMLRLNQAAEEFPAALRLDEVSVASWSTPLLRAATPNRIDHIPAEGVWVRLEGGNLADGSKVYLGDKEIKTVRFDPATGDLRIFLSSNTRLGVYDVRVVTAGGMEETLKAGLWIGQPLFAPIISTR